MTHSAKLAEYIARLTFDGIPASARQYGKTLVLDMLGVALGGSKTEHGHIAAAFAKDFAEKKEASVIGYRFKTSSLHAAFANSVMAHGIDFDDDYEKGGFHVGCAIIPTALALAEANGNSGKELITAIVGGYDVSCRVAAAIYPMLLKQVGFHITGLANCFGAAATAGKLLNLSKEKLVNAFGIAGDQASGLRQYHHDGTMLKHFHAGKAAQNGIFAALLAQKGFTGYPRIFEGKWGFCEVLSQGNYDAAELTRGLGKDFCISQTSFKPWAACRHTHTGIEAALDLRRENNLTWDNIQKVTMRTYQRAFEDYNKPAPQSSVEALLSLQYCVATALAKGDVSTASFWSDEGLRDKNVRELMKKIEVVADPELTEITRVKRNKPTQLEITTTDDRTLRRRIEDPLGSPENPMCESDITAKFRDLASAILTEGKVERLINSIADLEEVQDIGVLAVLLH